MQLWSTNFICVTTVKIKNEQQSLLESVSTHWSLLPSLTSQSVVYLAQDINANKYIAMIDTHKRTEVEQPQVRKTNIK